MTRTAIRIVPLLLMGLWLAPASQAAAPCSVPSATYPTIQSALDDPNCDPINVAAGTFNENLSVNRSVTIQGAGSAATIVDGTGTATVVGLDIGFPALTMNLRGLTVTGGGGAGCGGILITGNAHTVDLFDVVVTRNTPASDGGGVCSLDGTNLTLTQSSVTFNETNDSIGGISQQGGSLTLIDSHVDQNTAGSNVGGLNVTDATVVIERSTIDGNEAGFGTGGGYFSGAQSFTITDSSISGNVAGSDFGGLNLQQPATFTRVLMDGNRADGNVGGMSSFGPITIRESAFTRNTAATGVVGGLQLSEMSAGDVATMVNTTVSGNSAADNSGGMEINAIEFTGTNLTVTDNVADSDKNGGGQAGGIYFDTAPGDSVIRNTILFGNRDLSLGAEAPDCFGNGLSGGSNVIASAPGCFLVPQGSDKVGLDPLLLPLADNGGDTLTHAIPPGSPAFNAADPSVAPAIDQRGVARNPDIGAYELVLCKKVPANDLGTEGDDTITGGNEANGVLAFGGNDTVKTGGGKDAVCAGAGKDKVNGGGGKDRLFGEAGKDSLKGGGGKDRLNGGGGKDSCNGGGGNDKGKACEKERKI